MKTLLVVGTDKGAFLLRSNQDRTQWDVEGPLFKGWKATTSTRTREGTWLVGTASNIYGAAIQRSADLASWSQVPRGPVYPKGGDRKLNQIWRIVAAEDRLYAGVDEAGLFTSDDGGESWSLVETLENHPTRAKWFPGFGGLCLHSILVDPRRPERVWVGISAVGVFRSDDGGATWEPKNRGVQIILEDDQHAEIGFCVHGLAADPDDANVIYRQDHRGMYRTRDGGDAWERIENGLPSGFGFPIAIDPRTKALFSYPLESDEFRLPVDGACRVWRSSDAGDSWHACARGLPQENAWGGVLRGAMAVGPGEPAGVYFGTTSGSMFVSNDLGDSWSELPLSLPRILSVQAYPAE